MGTQGVVSIIGENKKVLYKIVVGCNGAKAPKLAETLMKQKPHGIYRIYDVAKQHHFGCPSCLVVMDSQLAILGLDGDDNDLVDRYRNTFQDPTFNPRWDLGTAAYVEIVDYDGLRPSKIKEEE